MATTKTQRKRRSVEKTQELKEYRLQGFTARTAKQKELNNCCLSYPLTVALGPAGTGKSYAMASAASRLLIEGKIDTIVLTRNPLPTGRSLGFFKGTDQEKMAIWLGPILNTFKKILSEGYFNYLLEKGQIKLIPMEIVKGSSFDRTFVLVEEAQECDMEQLKTLTTRIGEESYIALNGDIEQSNSQLKTRGFKDLVDAIKKENDYSINKARAEWDQLIIPVIEFEECEIVRSGLTRKMVNLFRRHSL